MAASIMDAFISKSSDPKVKGLLIQAKSVPQASDRIRELKALVRETFAGSMTPRNQVYRWDIVKAAQVQCSALGYAGGQEYARAVTALKHAWTSELAHADAVLSVM